MSLPRHFSLYNGVSERSRGWKSKRTDKSTEDSSPNNRSIMRWDGATKSSSTWDCSRRDPELWYQDGDCYVHLYSKGESRRGPAFKVPFSALLEANCYNLLDRFMAPEVSKNHPSSELDTGGHGHFPQTSSHSRVELYIPAPSDLDRHQAYYYHVATRNFFAFIFRRSLIGDHLGTTLISLLDSMHQFRSDDIDNLSDLTTFMDEEGYLDLKKRPSHALAILHFAEVFQLRDLYIAAFAHSCGMSDRIYFRSEYQLLSSVTRKLLRRTFIEMEVKLGQMGTMLNTFLLDELSEAHLGLTPGARAHLEHFRTLLHGFYAAKLGYYPPPSVHPCTTIFEVGIFQTLRTDFEALYNYLVDESFDPSQSILPSVQGGLCAVQSVQSFDARCNFATLNHPLPLLPEIQPPPPSRRRAWFGRQPKISSSQRAEIHLAHLKATNETRTELLGNDLVRVYRQFEEDSILYPMRGDKHEQLSYVDARKVRWILVYAIYQTVRQATQPPAEIKDIAGVPYNICISTAKLPPWKEKRSGPSSVRNHTDQEMRNSVLSSACWSANSDGQGPSDTPGFEIQPDIDYLGLLNREQVPKTESKPSSIIQDSSSRCTSLTRSISRSRAFRRSLRLFNNQESRQPSPASNPRSSQHYHEIVVLGYGNGTHDVEFTQNVNDNGGALMDGDIQNIGTTSRSPSTVSDSSDSNSASASEDGSASTADTALTESAGNSPVKGTGSDLWTSGRSMSFRGPERACNENFTPRAMSMYASWRPPASWFGRETYNDNSSESSNTQGSRASSDMNCRSMEPSPPRLRRMRSMKFERLGSKSSRIRESSNEDTWEDIKSFSELRTMSLRSVDVGLDSYNDLGGFTDLSDLPKPRRISTIF